MYFHNRQQQDFLDSPPVANSYVVFSTPRCGSSLLCEALCNTGLAGVPTEYFDENTRIELCRQWQIESWDDYIKELFKRKTGSNAVFGFKAHFHQYEIAFGTDLIPPIFPNLKFIWLTRQDKVRQAVSYAKAIQTNQWSSLFESTNDAPKFDYQQIKQLHRQTENEEDRLVAFAQTHAIEPLKLIYEQIVEAPFDAARQCLDYLGIALPADQPLEALTLTRQSDNVTEAWVEQYHAMQLQNEDSGDC